MADFNPDCAAWVYDTIAKMDDDEARAFGLMLVHDLWSSDMVGNERFVRSHQRRQDAVYTEDVAKALVQHLDGGGDPEEAVAIAAAVAVAKADRDAWKFQSRDQGGRFGRMTGAQYRSQIKLERARMTGEKKENQAKTKVAIANIKAGRKGYLGGGGLYDDLSATGGRAQGAAREFQEGWNRPSAESGATDTFQRLEAGGKLVQQLGAATGSNKTAIAGAVANYAGQFGPEAEKVVGPSMRKAAYRYRGTERTPDKQLTGLARYQATQVMREQGKGATDAMTSAERVESSERAAVQYLVGGYKDGGKKVEGRIPSTRLAELQRKSGRVTPSEGILIDGDGKIVAQAVGYGEDHYLPFNLKNLSSLKGGSYVRTRQSGGLTTEDIYTGLVSGARSMTVVSNSGTFTVDFADDLRGGRRYNDKARQMVGRYQQTLDAVQSEQVRRMPISRREKAEVRDEVLAEARNLGLSERDYGEQQIQAEVDQRLATRKTDPVLTRAEYEGIERESWKGLNRNSPSGQDQAQQRRIFSQLERSALDAKGQANYKLDGAGYKAALEALREQFPYFVADVRVQANRDDPELYTDGTDQGYVKPRYNRPTAAMSGYYGAGIGQAKVSAERTGYQNYRNRERAGTPREGGEPVPAGNGTLKPVATISPSDVKREKEYADSVRGAEAQRDQTTGNAGLWWLRELKKGNGGVNPYPHASVLDELENAEDKQAFLRVNGDKVRSSISRLEQLHPDEVARAPKVVFNPPKRTEAPRDLPSAQTASAATQGGFVGEVARKIQSLQQRSAKGALPDDISQDQVVKIASSDLFDDESQDFAPWVQKKSGNELLEMGLRRAQAADSPESQQAALDFIDAVEALTILRNKLGQAQTAS